MSIIRGAAALLLLLPLAACSNKPAATEMVEDVGGAYFDAEPLAGQTVTLTGEVGEVLNGTAFRLTGDEYGDPGLTIVVPDTSALEPGTVARITGVVTENDLAQVDEGFVVAADRVERLVPEAEGEESVAAAAEDLATALQQRAGDFAALVAGTLEDRGPYTVFAPEDAALAAQAGELLGNPGQLRSTLRHHVVEGEYGSAELAEVGTITTLAGAELAVSTQDGQVLVGGIPIVEPDVDVAGGVAHVIGGVLDPPAPR